MVRLGQIMLIAAALLMIAMFALVFSGIVDAKMAGGGIVLAIILSGSGSSISKKYRLR